jgi:hypothetical protein
MGEHTESFWRRVFPDAAVWLLKPQAVVSKQK